MAGRTLSTSEAFTPSLRRRVEGFALLSLGSFVVIGTVLGWSLETHRFVLVVLFLGSVAYIDARYGLIPNPIVAIAGLLGLGLHVAAGEGMVAVLAGLLAAGVCGAVRYLGIVWKGRPGMGMGDIKLALALGLLLGWPSLWVLYLAATAAAIAGLVLRARTGAQALPFAPWVAVGALLALTVLPFERVWTWVA